MDDRPATLFQPDILVPQGYWENCHSKASLPPEKMLMLAVLEDAIGCIQRNARRPSSREFSQAVAWILEEESDWPFSFENICAFLGLEATYLREGLLDWAGKKPTNARRGAARSVPEKASRRRVLVLRTPSLTHSAQIR